MLCVDDDPDIHTVLEMKMQPYDVQLERAYHGMQGVVESIKIPPDLILMDLAMPHGDGQYLLDCIRNNQETAAIPVMVLTGMRDPSLKRRLLLGGADVFLSKPVRLEELLHNMSRFINIRKRNHNGGTR